MDALHCGLRQGFGMTIFDDSENHLAGNIKKNGFYIKCY